MYLHVTTASELMGATGDTLLPHMLKCERPPWFNSSLNLVIQTRPSHQQIKKRWIPLCRLIQEQFPSSGPWIQGGGLRLRRQCYRARNTTVEIYYWHDGCYWKCTPPKQGDSHWQMQLQDKSTWEPNPHEDIEPIPTSARIYKTVYLKIP